MVRDKGGERVARGDVVAVLSTEPLLGNGTGTIPGRETIDVKYLPWKRKKSV